MPYVTIGKEYSGNIQLYYKDWGTGQPVVFSHGWPLSADSWEAQMLFLASKGYHCIAHDRRGHGRSSQPWDGNDMDTYADDLATLIETLDLRDAVLVGFSTGGGEVARYIGRHGTTRVAKVGLIAAVPPLMLKTKANPGGLPIEVFDGLRAGSIADRSQLYKDLASGPFFGFNRPGAKVSQGMIDSFWLQGMMGGHKNTYDCIKAFSETDFTEDLKKIDVPTLVVHGDDDQVVPIDAAGRASGEICAEVIASFVCNIKWERRGRPSSPCPSSEDSMKIKRSGSAVWTGGLKDGRGAISTQSGALKGHPYGYASRFEGVPGTNPEELLGAAHAGCFTMALSLILGEAGLTAERMDTTAVVTLERGADGFSIPAIHLTLKARIPGADEAAFRELAAKAKANCPVSRLFRAEITLDAQLV